MDNFTTLMQETLLIEKDIFKPVSNKDVKKRDAQATKLMGTVVTVVMTNEKTDKEIIMDVEAKPGKMIDVYLGIADAIRDYAEKSNDVADVTTSSYE